MSELTREKAINEQLRSAFPNPEKGVHKKGGYIIQQLNASRRRTEDVFIEMVDKIHSDESPQPEKHKKRKRRRGPRTLANRPIK